MEAGAPATLNIFEQRGVAGWKWSFSDERGRFEADVEFDVAAPDSQLLIERINPSAARSTGPDLRAELIRCLRAAIGEQEADAITTSPAPFLHVSGTRASHLALTLPYELLFRPNDPGRVIRIVGQPFAKVEPVRIGEPDSMLAAFTLRSEDGFLPLHREASVVERAARRANIAYDELFLACAAEDILSVGERASILHLTGHGHAGLWRCHWRQRDEVALTSSELIQAFGQQAPQLFVLDFCESSSEAEALRIAEATMTGMLALHDYSVQAFSLEHTAPSSSMAIDLAAALPTAVLALRTSADDTQARRFVEAFYDAFLVDRQPLRQAFARAVAEQGFYDDAGIPVPSLFLSSALSDFDSRETSPAPRTGVVRASSNSHRWCLNAFYKAIGTLGVSLEKRVLCSVSGNVGDSRDRLVESLDEAIRLWAAITGAAQPPEPVVKSLGDYNFLVRWKLSDAEAGGGLIGIDLESMPSEIALVELLANRRGIGFADLTLIGFATCDVPLTVEALSTARIEPLAERLRQLFDRSALGDRSLRWRLASELIDHLPTEQAATIRRWSDAKWERLQGLGPLAVDLCAARFVLGDESWLFESSAAAFDLLIARLDLDPDEVWETIVAMIEAGVGQRGTDLLTEESPKQLLIDMLTASRAWAACSEEAVAVYGEHLVNRQVSAMGAGHDLSGVTTERLASLGNLCVAVGDQRIVEVMVELERRDGGRAAAAQLRSGADASITAEVEHRLAAVEPDPWVEWRRLHEAGEAGEAEVRLATLGEDPEATDHPLRIDLIRLGTSDLDPAEVVERSTDLERRLIEPLHDRAATDTEHELLLMARQIKARALDQVGESQAAAEVLFDNFNFALAEDADLPRLIAAGSSAAAALVDSGDVRRARSTWDVIARAVEGLHPSEGLVVALDAEVSLLVHEGRLLRARVVSERLLDVIGAWSEPKPTVLLHALRVCAMGFNDRPESFALLALIRARDPISNGLLPNEEQLLADAFGHLTRDQVLRAAADLAAALPLAALGITVDEYISATGDVFDALSEMDPLSANEVRLGPKAVAALAARAADGCLMSETILNSLKESDPGPFDPVNEPAGPPELQRLASEHGRLGDILGHLVADNFDLSTPVTIAAFAGTREARTIWAGLMIGDFQRDLSPTVTPALLAIGAGEAATAQASLRPTTDNITLLCNACTVIESCCLDPGKAGLPDPESRVVSFARNGWQIGLEQIRAVGGSSRAVIKALSGSIAAPAELMAALEAAISTDRSLRSCFGVADQESLTGEVLDRIEGDPTIYLGLALATSEAGLVNAATPVLTALAGSPDPEVSLQAAHALLKLRIQQSDDGRDRKVEIEAAMDCLQTRLREIELKPDKEVHYLATVSHAGFRTGRTKDALSAIRASLAFPVETMDLNYRYSLHFNHVQILRALDGPEAGADALLGAGEELGFHVACLIFLHSKCDPWEESSMPFAVALSALAEKAEVEQLTPEMKEALIELSRSISEAAGWEDVTRMLHKELDDG
jgi:hypothetical protein